MLIFTNRTLLNRSDESAFTRSFQPAATRLGLAVVQAAGGATGPGWQVSGVLRDASDVDALNALLPLFAGSRRILVYLHGNNNTPAACFERCARLESMYGLEVIGFSWASEGSLPDGTELVGVGAADTSGDENGLKAVKDGNRTEGVIQQKIRRFRQAKSNAQDSIDALARFLRLLGTARLHQNGQPFSIAAHSLGAHFLQYTLPVPGAVEAIGTAHNVALIAACARAAGHAGWLGTLRPKGQVFVTHTTADSVLFGARIADGNHVMLGASPGTPLLSSAGVRYVSFDNAEVDFGAHGYFVMDNMPKKTRKLFQRMLGSARDFDPALGEYARQLYPAGCDANGPTCYMGMPTPDDGD